MKILHLIYDHINNPWVGGGGAVRVYEICRRLVGKGHEITVISGKYPDAMDYKKGSLEYRFLGNNKNYILSTFSYALEATRFIKRHGDEFEIIVEDFAPWNPVFSRFLTKRPVILHINHKEGWNIFKRWFIAGIPFYLLETFYPMLFDYVTVLSEETKKRMKISEATIVPAGINTNFIGVDNSTNKEDEERNYILYIGRLHIKNKGLDTLLSAMKGLDIKLIVVGRGKDEDRLKKIVERLKLKNVEFPGFLDEYEKMRILKGAQLFVLPSRFEGWGIVVLEAAICSKPVIVSDIPELSFVIQGGFGVSFKTGNADDLADKIKFLLENDALRKEMGLKARKYAKKYTWDKIAEDYERFLMKVVTGA